MHYIDCLHVIHCIHCIPYITCLSASDCTYSSYSDFPMSLQACYQNCSQAKCGQTFNGPQQRFKFHMRSCSYSFILSFHTNILFFCIRFMCFIRCFHSVFQMAKLAWSIRWADGRSWQAEVASRPTLTAAFCAHGVLILWASWFLCEHYVSNWINHNITCHA